MNLLGLALIAAETLYQSQRDPDSEEKKEELPVSPPWGNAIISIPKHLRKGKSYEEILEMKKKIWLDLHPEYKEVSNE